MRKNSAVKSKSILKKPDEAFVWIYGIAFICFICLFLPMKNNYYLRWVDSMNFFDSSSFEFAHLLNYPGGMLQYVGSFLTQLLYYPWLGTGVFVLLWSIIIVLLISTFQLKGYAIGAAFVVPACLLNGVLGLDENLLVLYFKGVAYSSSLGFLFVSICLWAFSRCGLSKCYVLIPLLSLLYPILGFYALLSSLLCALTIGLSKRASWILVISVIFIAIIPSLYYNFWHGTWADSGNMYLNGLPDFVVNVCDIMLWLPYIVIVLTLLFLCIGFRFKLMSIKIVGILSTVVFVVVLWWGITLSSKPESFRAMIMMQQSMDENNWDRVVRLASNLREAPTSDIVTISKLASQKTGKGIMMQEAENKNHINHPRLKPSVISTALISVPVSYHIGQSNLAYRWAMEHSIKYGRNVYLLKYMVRCSLLNGDIPMAQKYNSMIGKTLFHRTWADRYQKFIDNPGLMDQDEEFKLIPSHGSSTVFF